MKYPIYEQAVPQNRRKEFNEKLLYLIDNGKTEEYGISNTDVYNFYTGDGGLHDLNRQDYDSYAQYSDAKKGVENGQFLTPPSLCQLVAKSISPLEDALIADLTCGTGRFFNFMPTENNLYGCEIDTKAFKIARHLYPKANLENGDIRSYTPNIRFDYVVGNPPYNLKWWIGEGESMPSHLYYCVKAAELLKPYGILAVIAPVSFLADAFSCGSQIEEMENHFLFLGQIALPASAFASVGVNHFPTKLQFWQKQISGERTHSYRAEMDHTLSAGFDSTEAAVWINAHLLSDAKEQALKNRYEAVWELAKERELSADFQYRVRKMLYHIKRNPKTRDSYARCYEYLHCFFSQKKPDDMKFEEWEKKRLTEAKVLSYLKKALARQNAKPPQDRISLVKRAYDFIYKGYSRKSRWAMTERMKKPLPIYEIASSDEEFDLNGYERLIRRKRREYARQNQRFADMPEDPSIAKWLQNFRLWDSENELEIRLNDTQRHDLNRILQKRYGLLQ